jgi:hypothetical protein
MGFKISPFEAFNRAERIHDKVNRRNPTSNSKLPTLEEQLRALDEMEDKARQERLRKMEESKNEKRFSPLYEAKFRAEQSQNKKK